VALVARELELAGDERRQLLVALKKKNMWTTSADVHTLKYSGYARFEAG